MTRSAGFKPVCLGTVSDLVSEMRVAGIDKGLVNNIVGDPRLVQKANDWTAKVVSANPDQLIGMGWIHPQMEDSVKEVERCFNELKFRGLKLHFSNTRTLPYDPRVFPIYEKSEQLGIPLLVHCGPNVEDLKTANTSQLSNIQYSRPSNFQKIMETFPKLRMVLAHLAGAQHFKQEAYALLEKYGHLVVDTALGDAGTVSEMVRTFGASRVLLGSDYPVVRPIQILQEIRNLGLSDNQASAILSANAISTFNLT